MIAHITFFNHVHGEDGASMLVASVILIVAGLVFRAALGGK